jgi:TnpA family transposase
MERGNTTKTALLNAIDSSEKKQVTDICRLAGIAPSTYWFHFYKDGDFRRQVLEKKREYLTEKIVAETMRGENV